MRLRDFSIFLMMAVVLGIGILIFLYPGALTANVIWMEQGDEIKALDSGTGIVRTVQFYDVAGQNRTPICGFIVDGDHIWVEEGKDNELKGIKIYVRKVVLVRDQLEDKDVCKVAFANVLFMGNSTVANESQDETDAIEAESNEGIAVKAVPEENLSSEEGVVAAPEEDAQQAISAEEKPASMSLIVRMFLWIKRLFSQKVIS